jgi:acetyl-CoA acetyltransferase family protein
MAENYLNDDIVIVDAARSIIGAANGSLKYQNAAGLGHHIVNGLLSRIEGKTSKFSRNQIKHFIIGLCIGSGIGQNLPRQIARLSHLTAVESAFVVNEMCASALEAIILALHSLRLEEYPLVLAGGIEVPLASPYLITTQQLIDWKDKQVEEIQEMVVKSDMHDALWCRMFDVHTIVHAENTTEKWVKEKNLDPDLFRREIDEYAVMSHERALKATEEGAFKEELLIVSDASENDELPRGKSIEKYQRRQGTQFTPKGRYLTNLNSPALANCASFILMMKYREAQRLGLKPLARILDYSKSSVAPRNFLLAQIPAIKNLLKKTGTRIPDYDFMEINTAFGSQILINKMELGLDMDRVNCFGDCIALGHPVGAAGARLMTTLSYALKRCEKRLGLVSICLGGGNAIAMAVERLNQ